ncbi:MAG: diaminopimelate epimerase [Alphaproteobacteria bacterium]|nr:diaminopimelate epimerase [Alphaproteobacteria bacterium]
MSQPRQKTSDATRHAPVPFTKMHGLGNDFVVLDLRNAAQGGARPIDGAAARAIADRHRGVGCDQLIALEPPRGRDADIFMRIVNADGGEVTACGNASRCVADLLFDELGRKKVVLETVAGLLTATRKADGNVCVDLGPARHAWAEIPLAGAADTDDLPVEAGPLSHGVGVNIGNPHAVFFVARAEAIDLAAWGPKLEHDELFPERANISVAQILGANCIRLRVWERGAGLTQACGTAACAAVVAAARTNRGARNATVRLDGGELEIAWRKDGHVEMTGPVATSFTGTLSPSLFANGS